MSCPYIRIPWRPQWLKYIRFYVFFGTRETRPPVWFGLNIGKRRLAVVSYVHTFNDTHFNKPSQWLFSTIVCICILLCAFFSIDTPCFLTLRLNSTSVRIPLVRFYSDNAFTPFPNRLEKCLDNYKILIRSREFGNTRRCGSRLAKAQFFRRNPHFRQVLFVIGEPHRLVMNHMRKTRDSRMAVLRGADRRC